MASFDFEAFLRIDGARQHERWEEFAKERHAKALAIRAARAPTPTPLIHMPPNGSSTFTSFSRLPAELRNRIWQESLPGEIGACIYHWTENKGYWQPRQSAQSGEHLRLEFQRHLLDEVRFELSMAFVNREARGIAMAWAREQGCALRRIEKDRGPLFVRQFDPERDALSVEEFFWGAFLDECGGTMDELGIGAYSDVKHLAVHEEMLCQFGGDMGEFDHVFLLFSNLRALYVVLEESAAHKRHDVDMVADWRCEIGPLRFGSLVWNNNQQRFEFVGGESSDRLHSHLALGFSSDLNYVEEPDSLLERAERMAAEHVAGGLVERRIDSFEIRFVHAIDWMNGPFRPRKRP